MADKGFQPKTIEDYRDIVKILKVKVIKQTKYIQELEKKVKEYENQGVDYKKSAKFENVPMADSSAHQQTMSKDFDTQNLKNKSIVMYLFKKNAQKLGLSLEGIFRYADNNLLGELDCDEFRNILSKMSLDLTPKQISCLIYIFDEDCNGLITRNDYHNSLKAYVVSEEEKSRYYNNDCLLKITELFAEKKIDADGFFEQMKRSHKTIDINNFGELVKKKFARQLQQRQIVGAFNQIDSESQGILEKQSFSYSMKAYLAKPRDRSRTPPPREYPKTDQKFYPQPSKFSNKKQDTNKPSLSPTKTIDNFNPQDSSKIDMIDANKQIASVLLEITKQSQQTSQQIFTKILDHKFSTPITLNIFKRLLQEQSKEINNKLAMGFFRQIDKQERGSFDIAKLFEFYAENEKDPSVLLHMVAKHFESQQMDSNKFMFINSLKEDGKIDRKQFVELFANQLKVQQRFLDGLWNYFNKNGSDAVTISNIIKEIAIYQSQ